MIQQSKDANTNNDAYMFKRVLEEARVSLLNVSLVRMGSATTLSQFLVGAPLGHSMTFWQSMLATCLESFILEFVSLGLGLAGMREGLSTSLLSRWCGFGKIGSGLIGLTIMFSLIGWFGIQNSIIAESFLHVLDSNINPVFVSLLSGLLLNLSSG